METQGPSRRALFRGQLISKPVAVIGDGCLAEAGIVCRSCGDVCPEVAIRFRPRIGLPPQAIVNEATCTGCGECVGTCPGDCHHPGRRAERSRVMTEEATVHISSAVVSVLPDYRDDVLRTLATQPDVEVHHADASKIVIVMEAAESGNPRKPPR